MKNYYKTLSVTILFYGCFSQSSFSQIGSVIQWQNTIGGYSIDWPYSVQQTSDGGYILGGLSSSNASGDKTENSQGFSDYWIVKTDSSGAIQWQNTIGGSDFEWLHATQQTRDGGYILGGASQSNSSGDKTENSNGVIDYWIVKVNALGDTMWQNTIGGNSRDELWSIQQTFDGGYIMGGWSISDSSGDKTEYSNGDYDYWIIKTDSSGNIQWQNTIGGASGDFLYSIQQTRDSGYILGGWSFSGISGDKTESSYGGTSDYWIVKLDTFGSIQWQNTIGGNSSDNLWSLEQTSDGGFILGGSSNSDSSGDKLENSNGAHDYWIVKTDSTGVIQWENTIGANGEDFLYSIHQTSDSGYILGGESASGISGDKSENNYGWEDIWVVKTDSAGNVQWQNALAGEGDDGLYSLQQTSDGAYILGAFSSSNISGDKSENCNGQNDFWLVKLTENYNLITGKLFLDENSNGIQDTSEVLLANNKVSDASTSQFTFSQQNGIYNLSVYDSGNFSVAPTPLNYYNIVPATHAVYFPGLQQADSSNDFAFQPAGLINDLCLSLTPLGGFRAGRSASYIINYSNVGTSTLAGTVIFFPDNHLSYISSTPPPTSIYVDSVVWSTGSLAPFQRGSILVTLSLDAATPIGTVIHSTVRIDPVAGDVNPSCNYATRNNISTGAFDPNEILVDRDTVLTSELANPPYLEYIINFQNTGNDTAFDVRILNPIDTNMLQLNTLEFVASSNPVNMNYKPWEKNMEFTFNNILLPDSNINEPASHGFVSYKIKPKSSLVAGDIIENTAYIYFDFNQPVQTNIATTEIVLPTDLSPSPFPKERGVVLSPNPAKDELIVRSSEFRDKCELKIYDLFGREVFNSQTIKGKSQVKLDVSGFAKGVYLIRLTNTITGENMNGKIVISN